MYRYLIIFLSFFIIFTLTPAHAKRLALVIGNGDYKNAVSLPHSVNDAKKMATALRKLGFKVILKLNANEKTMTKAVRDFGQRLHSGDMGLFYFSGYGLQFENHNYLIPRWANIQNEANLEFEGLNVRYVLRQMTHGNRDSVNIVILEANRDNPYKYLNFKTGLEKMESQAGTVIAYAAAPHKVSFRDNIYTQTLLTALRDKAHLRINELLADVKKQVVAKTNGKQMPWHTTSLIKPVCFGKCRIVINNVSQQLRECERHFQANRLTSGAGGSAFDCYKKVLAKNSKNAKALAGLKKIEKRYLKWIKRALDRGQNNKAQQYLASLRRVNPTAPTRLFNLEAWVQSHRPDILQNKNKFTPNTFTAGKTFRDHLQDGSLGPKMVWIPPGSFKMGDLQGEGNSDEQAVHEVSIEGFGMGQYEITFEEYDRFVEATGNRRPNDNWGRGQQPVIWVSWQEATAYAQWLTQDTGRFYRLPTEAEWEYAARAGTQTNYWWGNDIGYNMANCASSGSIWSDKQTSPVGNFGPNQFGLYEMLGNVWEWTCSAYGLIYLGGEQHCVDKTSSLKMVLRGGSWFLNPKLCRAAVRNQGVLYSMYDNVGFRVVAVPLR